MGDTLALFQSVGRQPLSMDLVKSFARGAEIDGAASLSKRPGRLPGPGRLSGPGAFSTSSLLSSLRTSSSVKITFSRDS